MCYPDYTKYDLKVVKKEHIPPGEMEEFEEWEQVEGKEVIQDIAQPEALSNAPQKEREELELRQPSSFFMDSKTAHSWDKL